MSAFFHPRRLRNIFRGSPSLGHYIFAFVLVIRLIALARLSSSSLLLPGDGDMHFYDDWARRIARGQLTDHFAFYGLPGYAYLLAFLYKIFGYSPFVPGFLQGCLDAGTAVLIYKISARVFADARSDETRRPQIIGAAAALGWAFLSRPKHIRSSSCQQRGLSSFSGCWFGKRLRLEGPFALRCLAYGL